MKCIPSYYANDIAHVWHGRAKHSLQLEAKRVFELLDRCT